MQAQTAMLDVVEAFSAYLFEERMLANGTAARYRATVARCARFLGSRTGQELQSASRADLLLFLRDATKVDGEPSKVLWNSHLAALRAFYRFLCEGEVMDKNPAQLIRRHRVRSVERQPLSFDEMLRFVEVVRKHSPARHIRRNVALVLVFFHTALRVAEVVSLDVNQVDFENRIFHAVRRKGGKRLGALFNDVVAAAVFDLLDERHQQRAAVGEETPLTGPLFVSQRGTRLSVRAVQELVARYGRKAGILRPLTPHILRHSSATELADFAQLRVVQEHCGHDTIATTQRYVHVTATARRAAVDQLGVVWKARTRLRRRVNSRAGSEPEAQ